MTTSQSPTPRPFSVAGFSDNQWHHVAFVVDADGGRLYVDSLLQGGPGQVQAATPRLERTVDGAG